jgi:hypothetical protein
VKARFMAGLPTHDKTPGERRRILPTHVSGLVWGILAIACVDTSPVVVSNDGGGIIVPDDASLSDVVDPFPACSACIAAPDDPGPGCGKELKACFDTDPCMFIYDCAYANGCVFKKTHDESVSCAIPCAAQLKNAFDEALKAALALTACFHKVCGTECEVAP